MDKKADRNSRTAAYAERNGYYDVAISRYYYSVFQRIIFLLSSKYKEQVKPEDYTPTQSNGSHDVTIECFKSVAGIGLDPSDISVLSTIKKLKTARGKADYKPYPFDSNKYKLEFKRYFDQVDELLARIAQS